MDNGEIIERIKQWQSNSLVHPLTCGNDSDHALLQPKESDGNVVLACEDCEYVQEHIPETVLSLDLEEHEKQLKQVLADARNKGPVSREEAEKMARRVAGLDDQEGLGEVKVIRDDE